MKHAIPFVKQMTKLQKFIALLLLAIVLVASVANFVDWRPMLFGDGDFPDFKAETLAEKVQAGFPEVPPIEFQSEEVKLVDNPPSFLRKTPVSLKDVEEL